MSNTPFPFKVGDKVRLPWWETGEFVTITAVGVSNFLASDAGGVESARRMYRQEREDGRTQRDARLIVAGLLFTDWRESAARKVAR